MNQKEQQIRNKQYNEYVKQVTPTHNSWITFIKAYVVGGIICLIGQGFHDLFMYLGIPHTLANSYVLLTLIFLSVLLTGFNLVSPIAKFAGAGYLVPITGFANSVASCAIEFKKEGQVFGIGSQVFNIAGPVILYGIVSSTFFGVIYYILIRLSVIG